MEKSMRFGEKLGRLRERVQSPQWRRYGYLLAGGKLLGLDRVVVSPHVAGISVVAQQESLELAVSSVLAVLEGSRPAGLVNPAALRGLPEPALD